MALAFYFALGLMNSSCDSSHVLPAALSMILLSSSLIFFEVGLTSFNAKLVQTKNVEKLEFLPSTT